MLQLRLTEEIAAYARRGRACDSGGGARGAAVVNDRADVALAAGAAGVHVGVDDLSPALLRRAVPPGFIIGASVGSDAEVARAARCGLRRDRTGVRARRASPMQGRAIGIERFGELARRCGLPAVAIGGDRRANAYAADGGGRQRASR